jgi:hypothetical protein
MNIRVQLWIFFYLCTAYLPVMAQQLFIQEYPVELYKGSSQNWDIAQDAQGILYVGNTDGVLVYDGLEWKLVEMSGYPVAIEADDTGQVYIGSVSDMGYMKKDNAGEYHYHSLLSLLPVKDQQAVDLIEDIKTVGSTVYFSDLHHIYIYENGIMRVWNGDNNGVVILGGLAYATQAGNMLLYSDGKFEKVPFIFPVDDIRHLNDYTNGKYIIVDQAEKI